MQISLLNGSTCFFPGRNSRAINAPLGPGLAQFFFPGRNTRAINAPLWPGLEKKILCPMSFFVTLLIFAGVEY
jgi:hypothetical protein